MPYAKSNNWRFVEQLIGVKNLDIVLLFTFYVLKQDNSTLLQAEIKIIRQEISLLNQQVNV